ncbi:MAG: NFACT family protein [Cloacibacillus sp.]
MSFGPELIWIWTRRLSSLAGRRAQRVDGVNNSALISFGSSDLLLSWGAQNCGAALISPRDKKALMASSTQTPPITNAIKSHLTGAQLCAVEQLRRDRVMRFAFQKTVGAGFTTTRHLILEVMERYSNLLLTDEDGVIIETAKHIHPADNAFRTVLPGLLYHLPPEFEGVSLEEWLAAPSSETLPKVAGFGRPLLKMLSAWEPERAAALLAGFYKDAGTEAYITQKVGKYFTALPLLLDGAEAVDEDSGRAAALAPLKDSAIEARLKKIKQHLNKEIVRRERQCADIKELLSSEGAEKYRRWGELIVANLWQIKRAEPEVLLEGYDSEGRKIEETVPIEARYSVAQNAERYFAKYKKMTSAKERAAELLVAVEAELDDLNEEYELACCMNEAADIEMMEEELGLAKMKPQKRGGAKKKETLPPHKRFEFENAIVFAGLSSKGNRYVTFRLAQPDDVWFHAQGVPGSHVILRLAATPSDEERERLYLFCASVAAYYSKARANTRQRVDHTLRKHVSAIRGGEANVTYKEFSTIIADPDEWIRETKEE